MQDMMKAAAQTSQTMEDIRTQLIALNMRIDALLAFTIDEAGTHDEKLAARMMEVYNDLHRRLQRK